MMPLPSPKIPRTPLQAVCPPSLAAPRPLRSPRCPADLPRKNTEGGGEWSRAGIHPKRQGCAQKAPFLIFFFPVPPSAPASRVKSEAVPSRSLLVRSSATALRDRDAGDTKGRRGQRCFLRTPNWVFRFEGLKFSPFFFEDLGGVPGPGDGAFQAPWGCPLQGTVSATGSLLGTGPHWLTHRRAVQPGLPLTCSRS